MFGLMFLAMLAPAFPQRRRDHAAAGVLLRDRSVSAAMIGLTAAMYAVVFFPSHVLSLYEMLARRHRAEARGEGSRRRVVDHPRPERAAAAEPLRRRVRVDAGALAAAMRSPSGSASAPFGDHLPFSAALFLQGIIAIGVAAPQMPGFFGVFECFGQVGLGLYGVSERHGGRMGHHLSRPELHPDHAHRRVVLRARRTLHRRARRSAALRRRTSTATASAQSAPVASES